MTPERAIQEAQAALLAGQPDVAKQILEEAADHFPDHDGVRAALADLGERDAGNTPDLNTIEIPCKSPNSPQIETHSGTEYQGVPLVRSMGKTWDVLGWLLVILNVLVFIAFLMNYIPVVPRLMEGGYAKMFDTEWVQAQMPEVVFRLIQIAQVGAMLAGFWLSLDIMDHRGRPIALLGALFLAMCCCTTSPVCGPAFFLIPIQIFVGRKVRWRPPTGLT